MTLSQEKQDAISRVLQDNPSAVLEHAAKEAGVRTVDIVLSLPEGEATMLHDDQFEAVMEGLTEIGRVTFIVHTADIVLECKGEVPRGSFGRGFFNIHGDSPIGGHIKADNCGYIFFISRALMGRESHSIQFYNKDGECMYKVYLGRDGNRELIPEQVEKYKALREKLATAQG